MEVGGSNKLSAPYVSGYDSSPFPGPDRQAGWNLQLMCKRAHSGVTEYSRVIHLVLVELIWTSVLL